MMILVRQVSLRRREYRQKADKETICDEMGGKRS